MNELQLSSQFEQLFDSAILMPDDFGTLVRLKPELINTLKKTQIHRTRTEMEVSVLNDTKFPTPASKYWQSVREQAVMFEELILLSFEYRKKSVEVKILKRDLGVEEDDLERELLQIKIEKEQYVLSAQERVAKARIREIQDWSEIKSREMALMNGEDMKDADHHQLISYTKRWIQQSFLMGNNGSPAERQNLLGQLRSGITSCIRLGLLDVVLEGFPRKIQNDVKKSYGVS